MSFRSMLRSIPLGVALMLAVAPVFAAEKVLVFAAASMKNALDSVVAAYKGGGPPILVSYAASSTLAKQVENGAPADLFVSADEAWMNYLSKKGLVDASTRKDLLGGQLVLIAPSNSLPKAPVTFPGNSLLAALESGRLAVGEISTVPAGKYGKEALEHLQLWGRVKDHLAQADNVRGALTLVARGEAPLGIVYATDALADPRVKVVAVFPEDSHTPIVYPVALLTTAPDAQQARAFLKFMEGAQAATLFEKQGFKVLH